MLMEAPIQFYSIVHTYDGYKAAFPFQGVERATIINEDWGSLEEPNGAGLDSSWANTHKGRRAVSDVVIYPGQAYNSYDGSFPTLLLENAAVSRRPVNVPSKTLLYHPERVFPYTISFNGTDISASIAQAEVVAKDQDTTQADLQPCLVLDMPEGSKMKSFTLTQPQHGRLFIPRGEEFEGLFKAYPTVDLVEPENGTTTSAYEVKVREGKWGITFTSTDVTKAPIVIPNEYLVKNTWQQGVEILYLSRNGEGMQTGVVATQGYSVEGRTRDRYR